jgi:signal recognition particle GTPase
MYTQKDLIGDEYKSFVSRIKLFDDIKELINNDFNNNDLINQIEKVDNNCGVLSTVIDNLKNIASKNNKQNDEYKEYKENISNIFNKIICTLIQHWEKTREPFLTNSNIDTGILNIDFYHLYE